MALKLNDALGVLKKIGVDKAIEKVTSVSNSILKTDNNLTQEEVEEGSGNRVIDSIDSLNIYLQTLQVEASPVVVNVLQSQMQILKYVQSPTMTLMAIDNVMLCLHKALKTAENEQQKELLRESFTSVLQSFIFVTEARLRYEIDSNRDEAVCLLADAGDLLMSSVSNTAMMVASGINITHALPKMVNVFAEQNTQRTFLGRLIMAKGKKALIEEKKAEFDKTLNFIFDTLDKYAELVGPSILLHGMLRRYADGLLERYKISLYESVANKIDEKEGLRIESFTNNAEHTLSTNEKDSVVKQIFDIFNQVTQSRKVMDYDSIINIRRTLQSELNGYETQLAKFDSDIKSAESELKKFTMLLQGDRKRAMQNHIASLQAEINSVEHKAMVCRQKIGAVSDIIDPINESINFYQTKLQRVVDKYEVSV
ncbi:MAG: hypothetical protein IKV14_03550 [Muribaculaceae bacterium]|nr:hypothetical protein [Muribaculaceae bacterium]